MGWQVLSERIRTTGQQEDAADRPTPSRTGERRVYFLVSNADAPGGLVRVVVNLANHFAELFDVEIISVFRRSAAPFYTISDRVKVTHLLDQSEGEHRLIDRPLLDYERTLGTRPSRLAPLTALKDQRMSMLTDLLMWRYLRSLPTGILISTHPSLHAASVRLASNELVKIGQEHMSFEGRNQAIQSLLQELAGELDAVVTLTDSDRRHFSSLSAGSNTLVRTIPNALPWAATTLGSNLEKKTVVAAGALLPRKGFRRLIEAFSSVAEEAPGWELHIYGQGERRRALRQLIDQKGLADRVFLKGQTDKIETVFSEGSVFALSSFHEGFAMVLAEAMSKGVPAVAFDCPSGPADIVTDGVDGYLIEEGDMLGFSQALLRLMQDDELRLRMGHEALKVGERYQMSSIIGQWLDLFDELRGASPAS
jgi:glycosyltransferase involved in cell wall biosynthesis